jgi:hypothetical protein
LVSSDSDGIREDSSYTQTYFGTVEDRAAGKFELRGIRPGRYELYAMQRDPDNLQVRSTGHVEVNVGNQDVTGVRIVLTAGVELRLRFVANDSALLSQAPTQVRLLSLHSMTSGLGQPAAMLGQNAADWRVYSGVIEGQYFLDSPLANLRTAYIADIRQGERSVYESGIISVGNGTAEPVEIVLAGPAGAITGNVQTSPGKSVAGVQVVLIPNNPRRQNALLYKRAVAADDGQFNLQALAPGGYKLFAFESLPSSAELNAEFLKPFEDFGVPVTIETGGQLKVQIPLMSAR